VSENRRRSVLRVLPRPDGGLDAGDRRQVLGLYRFETGTPGQTASPDPLALLLSAAAVQAVPGAVSTVPGAVVAVPVALAPMAVPGPVMRFAGGFGAVLAPGIPGTGVGPVARTPLPVVLALSPATAEALPGAVSRLAGGLALALNLVPPDAQPGAVLRLAGGLALAATPFGPATHSGLAVTPGVLLLAVGAGGAVPAAGPVARAVEPVAAVLALRPAAPDPGPVSRLALPAISILGAEAPFAWIGVTPPGLALALAPGSVAPVAGAVERGAPALALAASGVAPLGVPGPVAAAPEPARAVLLGIVPDVSSGNLYWAVYYRHLLERRRR
jgi:hypothetical protein